MEPDRKESNEEGSSLHLGGGKMSWLAWLVASLFATVVISLAAAHAPPRVRLIGLFPIASGLLTGWLLAWLSRQFEVAPSRRVSAMVGVLLALGGWIGTTWETYRLDELLLTKSPNDELAARMMQEFDQQSKGADVAASRPSVASPFRAYLSRRIRQLGTWPRPWPECFWLLECAAASLSGGMIASGAFQPANKAKTAQPAVTDHVP